MILNTAHLNHAHIKDLIDSHKSLQNLLMGSVFEFETGQETRDMNRNLKTLRETVEERGNLRWNDNEWKFVTR